MLAGSHVWHLAPEAAPVFGHQIPDPAAWLAAGIAVVVKENLQRTISRAELPGGVVFIKVCRANTPRALAREWLRRAKAELEFRNLTELRRRGIAAIEPLAWGRKSCWPGESILITRAASADTEPLAELLARNLTPAARRQLATDFARYLAQLHQAGIAHPDPHPGNILRTPSGEFLLTDLHALRPTTGPLPWPAARRDLVLWNRYFQVHAHVADRARFWKTYSKLVPVPPDAAADIEHRTRQSNLRFWTARLKRYAQNNRDSHAVRGRAGRGFAARNLVLDPWLNSPEIAFAGATLWKNSASATVAPVRVEFSSGEQSAVLKQFHPKSAVRVVKNAFRPSPAWRSWVYGHNLRDRGLPTPRPLLILTRRRFGIPFTSFLLFEQVPGALELPAVVLAATEHPDRRQLLRRWADTLGRLIRAMHDREVSHRDLKASNIIMQGAARNLSTAQPVLIDLVGVTVGRPISEGNRQKEVTRLAVSFHRHSRVNHSIRLKFLRAYLGRTFTQDWKQWWRAIEGNIAEKLAQNQRRGRPLG